MFDREGRVFNGRYSHTFFYKQKLVITILEFHILGLLCSMKFSMNYIYISQ